jgi:hypothetical protein
MGSQIYVKGDFVMKKGFLLGALVLVLAFGFIGCDTGSALKWDAPEKTAGFTKGLDDFVVQTGDKPGMVKCFFTETVPSAGSYKLYYVQGVTVKAQDIIAAGKSTEVQANSDKDLKIGNPNKMYSFVVVAQSGGDNAKSGVKAARTAAVPLPPPAPTGGKSMTVTDIPSSVTIDYAFLFSSPETIKIFFMYFFGVGDKIEEEDNVFQSFEGEEEEDGEVEFPFELPIFAFNRNGKFVFEELDGHEEPSGKAWNGSGEYYIALIGEENMDIYVYTAGAEYNSGKNSAKFNFIQTSSYIAFSQFVLYVDDDIPESIIGTFLSTK